MGKFLKNLLQRLIHEATLSLSVAINTSSEPGAVLVDRVLLYMKFKSSMRAASSVALIRNVSRLYSDSLISIVPPPSHVLLTYIVVL